MTTAKEDGNILESNKLRLISPKPNVLGEKSNNLEITPVNAVEPIK